MRRRMNLRNDTYLGFFDRSDMDEAVRSGRHPLSMTAAWHYNAHLMAIELRIAAERWRLAHGGEVVASIRDVVPQLVAAPGENAKDDILWDVRSIEQPDGRRTPVVVRCYSMKFRRRDTGETSVARDVVAWFGDAEAFEAIARAALGSAEHAAGESVP